MNWCTIWENTISGIFVVVFGGITGWIFYSIGIRGKEKAQTASQRKHEIYIPLKYELLNLTNMPDDIWKKIDVPEIKKIVEKNDELVIIEDIFQKCNQLLQLVAKYNGINLYTVASNVLCKRFEEKYIELYGSKTHIEWVNHYGEDIEIDVTNYEIAEFYEMSTVEKYIDNLFKSDALYEDFCQDEGYVGPIEEYLSRLFAAVLPKGDKTYSGVKLEVIGNKAMHDKKMSPAEYIARDFDFYKEFNDDEKVKDKEKLLAVVKELSFSILEDVQVKIKYIGTKYERE